MKRARWQQIVVLREVYDRQKLNSRADAIRASVHLQDSRELRQVAWAFVFRHQRSCVHAGSNIVNTVKADRVSRLVDTVGEREAGPAERVAWKPTQQRMENRQPVGICCVTQGPRTRGSVTA